MLLLSRLHVPIHSFIHKHAVYILFGTLGMPATLPGAGATSVRDSLCCFRAHGLEGMAMAPDISICVLHQLE